MLDVPLQRVLGDDIGAVYAQIHRDHGVDLRLGEGVERFEGSGRVEAVIGSSGDALPGRPRRRRRRHRAERRARRRRRDRVRQRDRRRRAVPDVGAERVRRRRRRDASRRLLRRIDPHRALPERAEPGPGGGALDARQGRAVPGGPVVLVGPVRRESADARLHLAGRGARSSAAASRIANFIAFYLRGDTSSRRSRSTADATSPRRAG